MINMLTKFADVGDSKLFNIKGVRPTYVHRKAAQIPRGLAQKVRLSASVVIYI